MVENGKIVEITSESVRAVGNAVSIDATRKLLVPGYLDIQAHATNAADPSSPHWLLVIANGVTSCRP